MSMDVDREPTFGGIFSSEPGTENRSRFLIEKGGRKMWVVCTVVALIAGAVLGMLLTALLIAGERDDRP